MSNSGKVPAGYVRLTLNVREVLQRKLKMAGVMTRTTMGNLVEQLIDEKLDDILRGGIRPIYKRQRGKPPTA